MNYKRLVKFAVIGILLILGLSQVLKHKDKIAKKILPKLLPWRRQIESYKPKQKNLLDEAMAVAPVVKAYKVSRIDFKDVLPAIGTVKGESEVDMRFEIPGVIEKIVVREGDLVDKGDIIAKLEDKDIVLKVKYRQAKLESAKAAYEANQKKLEMNQKLYDIGAILKVKLEQIMAENKAAKKEVDAARIELQSSQAELEKVYLYAPVSGVVATKNVEPGEYITSQVKVTSIIKTDNVFVEVGIIEQDIDKIGLDEEVIARVDTYPNIDFIGKIDNIFPVIEGKSRTLTVRAKIPNPENQLLPGMFARVSIAVFEKDNALVIPTIALEKPALGTNKIFIIENETAFSREIEVGYITSDYAQIDFGIEEGELVVIESQEQLKDGIKVEVADVQEAINASQN